MLFSSIRLFASYIDHVVVSKCWKVLLKQRPRNSFFLSSYISIATFLFAFASSSLSRLHAIRFLLAIHCKCASLRSVCVVLQSYVYIYWAYVIVCTCTPMTTAHSNPCMRTFDKWNNEKKNNQNQGLPDQQTIIFTTLGYESQLHNQKCENLLCDHAHEGYLIAWKVSEEHTVAGETRINIEQRSIDQ